MNSTSGQSKPSENKSTLTNTSISSEVEFREEVELAASFDAPTDKHSDASFDALADKHSGKHSAASFNALADKHSGEGFDAPPTLERSGSEHQRAVTSPVP